jgi:hypothetical protein
MRFTNIDDLIPKILTPCITDVASELVGSTLQNSFVAFQFNLRTCARATYLPYTLVLREIEVNLLYNEVTKENPETRRTREELLEIAISLTSDSILAVQEQNTRMPVTMNANRLNCIASLWTAFETLAGDAWEETINYCPNLIKPLLAIEKYKSLKTAIDFNDLEFLNFDLNGNLGTLYKRQVRLLGLGAIRAIYRDTFGADFGKILKGSGLTYLESLRHVIVHRAAVRDRDYLNGDATSIYDTNGKLGEYIWVSGTTVMELAREMETIGCELLRALRSLLEANGIK